MVKKRLADGAPCRKCVQTEDMLRKRGLWDRIDDVVWALEGEPDSPGMQLGARLGVDQAPFFVVSDGNGTELVYESVLRLVKEQLGDSAAATAADIDTDIDTDALAGELGAKQPAEILRWGLSRFGDSCAIAFSGADDVALIDMAAATGLAFSTFVLDTGRLHPETYEFIDRVRVHYGIEIDVMAPDAVALQGFVRAKGLFSFYDDGHAECCSIRKVEPLGRALASRRAWVTGQRRDQSPDTRAEVAVIERDAGVADAGGVLIKLNPLAGWSSAQLWSYLRDNDVPYNALHERGFASIGCAPCTRPVLPGQHEREGRWWWEQADKKECGLHVPDPSREHTDK